MPLTLRTQPGVVRTQLLPGGATLRQTDRLTGSHTYGSEKAARHSFRLSSVPRFREREGCAVKPAACKAVYTTHSIRTFIVYSNSTQEEDKMAVSLQTGQDTHTHTLQANTAPTAAAHLCSDVRRKLLESDSQVVARFEWSWVFSLQQAATAIGGEVTARAKPPLAVRESYTPREGRGLGGEEPGNSVMDTSPVAREIEDGWVAKERWLACLVQTAKQHRHLQQPVSRAELHKPHTTEGMLQVDSGVPYIVSTAL